MVVVLVRLAAALVRPKRRRLLVGLVKRVRPVVWRLAEPGRAVQPLRVAAVRQEVLRAALAPVGVRE